jgi:glycosyltransferase involved in cell wall biosynthesis
MKVLFLFNGTREGLIEKVKTGEYHGDGFWGMLRLAHYGIQANYIELERVFPKSLVRFLRNHINIYFIHVPIFWKIFAYDIVFTSSAFGAQLFHAIFRIKKPIWVMHDFSIVGLLGNEKTFRQKLFKFMVTRAKAVVTLSVSEKIELEKRFPHLRGNVEFIPFGVDAEFFKPDPASVEEQQILAVGFDPDRDWETLIDAVKDLNVKVVLATRPERIKKLLPLPAHIVAKQFTPKELVREYSKSQIIIVPLNTSGRANDAMGCSTLFEGMAMAKPVIVTQTRATESYITHGENGLLVKEGDAEDLKQNIEKLLNNKELRGKLGTNARAYALQELDPEKRAEQLATFFKKIASGNNIR